MPTSYTWDLVETPLSGSPPNPGPFVPTPPGTVGIGGSRDSRRDQFERGIKFANVPGGRADFVVHGGPRVYHVNGVPNVLQEAGEKIQRSGMYSGDIKFRFRNYRRFPVPASVNKVEFRSSNRFTDPVFPFTGQYPSDHTFFSIGDGTSEFEGNMAFGRSRYAAGLLLTASQAIVAGGWLSNSSGISALSSSQTYFSGTGLWTTIQSMPTGKIYPAGVVLSGTGNFLVVGGSSGSAGDDVEGARGYLYQVASGTWIPTSGTARVARRDFEMVQIADGRVFLPGGLGSSFTGSEFYDPATNSFSGTLPLPMAPLNREGFTTTLLGDNSILVVGGWDPSDKVPLDHSFRFYPSQLSWSIEPSMSFGRAGHQTVYTDGNVLVMGGYDPSDRASFPFLFPSPLGGFGAETSTFGKVEIYNPVDRTWRLTSDMPVSRARFGAVGYERDGGRVIVFGGHNSFVATSRVDIFVFQTETWTTVTSLLTGTFDIEAVLLNPGNATGDFKILIPGGTLSGSVPMFSGSQLYRTSG